MASIKTTVKVTGFKECEKALLALPKSTAKNTLLRALDKAAQPIYKAWVDNAPVMTGRMKNQGIIISKKSKYNSNIRGVIAGLIKKGMARSDAVSTAKAKYGGEKNFAEIYIGVLDSMTHKAIATEFGTQKMAARPHGRPAWEAEKEKALEIIKEILWEEIQKAAARYARKLARQALKAR